MSPRLYVGCQCVYRGSLWSLTGRPLLLVRVIDSHATVRTLSGREFTNIDLADLEPLDFEPEPA